MSTSGSESRIIRTHPAPAAKPGAAVGTNEFSELARAVRSSGLMRRRYGYYWTKLLATPVVLGISVLLFIRVGDTWWQLLLAAGFAIVFTQIAFLGHDAAHRQIFKSGKWNDWISLIVGDLFVGMSYGWWQRKHTLHHDNPNREDVDPDINLKAIAFTPAQAAARRNALTAWLAHHQGVFFIPVLFLEGVSLHASSIRRVVARQHVDRRWVEIVFITVRLGSYLALVFIVLSPGIAIAFIGVQMGLFGFYMGMSFAPNHKGMPLLPKDARVDFLRRQVLMSRNIRGNVLVDVAMGGLNYQIEHHLFPSMPRPHLRHAAPLIAEYCAAHKVTYTETGLWQSYGIVLRYINQVGLSERDPFLCPLAAQRTSI